MSLKRLPRPAARSSRRAFLANGVKAYFAATLLPSTASWAEGDRMPAAQRSINVMNFLRAEEPREPQDLFRPLKEQMALIRGHRLPATWLLQYDALVEGPFVPFLKREMPVDHECGIWLEMNRKICEDADVEWRGRKDWEWDYHVPVAYSIGYTPEERRKLADAAMRRFRQVFGRDAKVVASWNLDAVTLAHLADHYAVDAFANCRDQIATDGFTIWGGPIAGYYPSRRNAWSPALSARNQIATPMFRLLGQDPVYYYDNQMPQPDTMEPVWKSGQSPVFVDAFLKMIAEGATQRFAYAQLGQENSFGWPAMKGYAMQMEKLAAVRDTGRVHVETMSETGRRFKRAFRSTPAQAQVMLTDPFDNTPAERTVWYQSQWYRANLHFRGEEFYLRDLHVYEDGFAEPYLADVVRQHGIEQRLLAVLDGYHWSDGAVQAGRDGVRAAGRLLAQGRDQRTIALRMCGSPAMQETPDELRVSVPVCGGRTVEAVFSPRDLHLSVRGGSEREQLVLQFEWVRERSALRSVTADRMLYRYRDFEYAVGVANGTVAATESGARVVTKASGALRLLLAQT
jgi:hypothetical protein